MRRTSEVGGNDATRVVAPTQNSMNYHVSVDLFGSVWGTNLASMRVPIPANGTKDNEFPLFFVNSWK